MNYQNTKILAELLPRIKNKGLNGEEFKNILLLKKSLYKNLELFKEGQVDIVKSYELKEEDGVYNWKGHLEENDINHKILDFQNSSLDVEPLNFLSIDAFADVTIDLEFGFIEFLETFLLSK